MHTCKSCQSDSVVKSGHVRGKQRYKCKDCGINFTLGDGRVKYETAVKRAFAIILYALGKASYGFIAKLFGVTPPAVQKWIKREADVLELPKIEGTIKEIEFDEMWHFIQSKKTKNGSLKRWTVLVGEPLPGLSAIVMLKPSSGSMTRLSI